MSPVRRPRAAAVALATLMVALVTGGLAACSSDGSSTPRPSEPPSSATDSGTPLQDLDTTALLVRRAPFCDLVDPAAVTRALGTEPDGSAAYRSGQRTRVSTEVSDVVHEFGCVWKAGGSRAKAWVFVPPVTHRLARALAKDATGRSGCSELAGAADFGTPSAAVSCREGAGTTVAYQGLFGDAWLTCTLTSPGGLQQELAHRAGTWCAAVAVGAAATAPAAG